MATCAQTQRSGRTAATHRGDTAEQGGAGAGHQRRTSGPGLAGRWLTPLHHSRLALAESGLQVHQRRLYFGSGAEMPAQGSRLLAPARPSKQWPVLSPSSSLPILHPTAASSADESDPTELQAIGLRHSVLERVCTGWFLPRCEHPVSERLPQAGCQDRRTTGLQGGGWGWPQVWAAWLCQGPTLHLLC